MTAYTTWGPVRGACGHAHRSLAAAERCLDRDARGCLRQGGYSDRSIRAVAAGELTGYDVTRGPGRPVGDRG